MSFQGQMGIKPPVCVIINYIICYIFVSKESFAKLPLLFFVEKLSTAARRAADYGAFTCTSTMR